MCSGRLPKESYRRGPLSNGHDTSPRAIQCLKEYENPWTLSSGMSNSVRRPFHNCGKGSRPLSFVAIWRRDFSRACARGAALFDLIMGQAHSGRKRSVHVPAAPSLNWTAYSTEAKSRQAESLLCPWTIGNGPLSEVLGFS